jgi:predicted Zn-dependent peptidase
VIDKRVLCVLCGCFFVSLVAQERPDRSKPPALGPPPRLELPPIQKRTLSNGLPVWLIESHEVPIAQVNLVVLAGSGDDPAGKFGVAGLTAAMLDEGAGSRSALEISDAVEQVGGVLGTGSSFDASAVRLNAPVSKLRDALGVMADVALRPTFPQVELDRLRQERITALLQARDDPPSIASRAFSRILFGPSHRYGTGGTGTENTLKTLSADDLRAFHSVFYQPSNAAFVVVGDIETEAILPELEARFGVWKAGARATRKDIPIATQPARGQIHIVDKPDAEQSQIVMGWVGVPRSTSDYFTLVVLNTILGGSFTSRLNQNLRERHGYTYGASSAFDMRLSAGPFIAAAGVQTDKTAEALREFFNELKGISGHIAAEELARARNYVALGFPAEFETSSDLSRRIEELIVYELPEDYFERYVPAVQAVTADDIRKAAARYIEPSQFVVVIVGDRKRIEPGIRATDLGPVRVMTVDEALN